MVSLREFLGPDGVSIRWGRLATLVLGAGVYANFEGIVSTMFALADIPLALLAGLGNFLGRYYEVAGGFPAVLIRAGYQEAVPYVTSAGLAGYAFAITIVLVTLFSLALVIDLVR